jgi:glucose/arabinose dehydrogenase
MGPFEGSNEAFLFSLGGKVHIETSRVRSPDGRNRTDRRDEPPSLIMWIPALSLALLVLAGCAGRAGSGSVGSAPPASAEPSATSASGLVDIGAGLQGPAGLAATVVATGLPNVASLAVDPNGRIWAGTAAFDDAGTDMICVIAAGSAPVKVIGGLHTVLGLAWVGGTLFVAAKESITAWTGFDGSAFTSHRAVVTFPAGVGEVNGIAHGPDGRLVVGISAPCDACDTTDPASAAIVSFLPDGSDLRIEATGIRAPVGLAFRADTGDLFVTMNQRDDLGDATPGDWLAVVVRGQDWGFPDCYGQADAACVSEPTPVAALDTHAAASGVAIVNGQPGTTVGTSAIVAEWARGVVLRVALTGSGSATTGVAVPFVVGLQNPVPVLADGMGGVLIGDWATGRIVRIATIA